VRQGDTDDCDDDARRRWEAGQDVPRRSDRRGHPWREHLQGSFRRHPRHRRGRSAAYEKELRKAREIALQEAQQAAADRGANALVGVDIDYETVGNGSMLMVSVSGTAVTVE
jgi:hypothetical protein